MPASRVEAAILLAGGESRRMGRDKTQLPFEGRPLVVRMVERLTAVFPEVVVVVREPAGFPLAGVRLLTDRHPGRGPLEGLATGLSAIRSDRALVVACDMPLLDIPVLRLLAAEADDADVIVPVSDTGPEPLCAVYARRLLPRLDAALASGERRMKAWLATLDAREMPPDAFASVDPEGHAFLNLNRPEDYARAIALSQRPEGP
jgi:molybdopterin-guanine dinucleotide biosynthesis protein A